MPRSATSRYRKGLHFEAVEHRYLLAGDIVTTRLAAVDLSGQPVDVLRPGDPFLLQVYATDTSDATDERGIFSLYLDITYDQALAEVAGELEYAADFRNGQEGDTSQPGLIDDVGAFTRATDPDPSEVLVVSVPMTAKTTGTINFQTDGADRPPITEVLLFGSRFAVPEDEIYFDQLAVAATLPGDLDRDFDVDFADFLLLSARFGNEGAAAQPADIDGDGRVGFSDFLVLSGNFGRKLSD